MTPVDLPSTPPESPFGNLQPTVPPEGWTHPIAEFFGWVAGYYAAHPAGGLFLLAGTAIASTLIAAAMTCDDFHWAWPIAVGSLHTAIWSLAAAVYLTLGPDVGTFIPDDMGPWWVMILGGPVGFFVILNWPWPDPPGTPQQELADKVLAGVTFHHDGHTWVPVAGDPPERN